MPTLTPYSLTFPGGLHAGTRGPGLADAGLPVPSDTLFAALIDATRRAGGDPAALLAPYLADPPAPLLLITSAFPRLGQVRFFPMPADPGVLFSPGFPEAYSKAISRIRWLSWGLLQRALAGQALDDWLFPGDAFAEPETGAALQGGQLWLAMDELLALPPALQREPGRRHALPALHAWAERPASRAVVDRVTSASTSFHAGRISFAEGCGLWFGAAWLSENTGARQAFERALAMLAIDGLGGERSVGYGAFQYEAGEPLRLANPRPGGLAYLLSRYCPRPAELPYALAADGAAYGLAEVGGSLRSPDGPALRRKRARLVTEGSLVSLPGPWGGILADVTPEPEDPEDKLPHPVYRYGLAVGVEWPR